MARLNMVVDDDLEAKFRDTVYRRLGMKKGNIQKAVEEALQDWMDKKPVKETKSR